MTEKETLEKGHHILKAERPMSRISRAKEMGETTGFIKVIVDADSDLILGVSILGVGGDEIINMFAAVMFSQIPCKEYRKVVLVHPTVSELMPWILGGLKRGQLTLKLYSRFSIQALLTTRSIVSLVVRGRKASLAFRSNRSPGAIKKNSPPESMELS